MNSTAYTTLFISMNSSNTTIKSWFIPVDIIAIIFLALTMLIGLMYLLIIIFDKTCHTIRMMLVGNICLTGFMCATIQFSIIIITLQHDLRQLTYEDSLCVLRAYLSYSSLAIHCYSSVLSAVYQYIAIVHPTRAFLKSLSVHLSLIIFSWILGFIYPIPFTVDGEIIYDVNNQLCKVPIRLSFATFYIPFCLYIMPVNLVIFIFRRLVRYVGNMAKHTRLNNTLNHAQRDLKMVRRIVIIILIPLAGGLPMSLFALLSFGNKAPKYYLRIGFVFVYISLLCVMITLFKFTDSLQASVKKIIHGRIRNTVIPVLTLNAASIEKNARENKAVANIQPKSARVAHARKITVQT